MKSPSSGLPFHSVFFMTFIEQKYSYLSILAFLDDSESKLKQKLEYKPT